MEPASDDPEAATEPIGESRTLFDMCAGVAERMGIGDAFTEGRTHDEWVEHMFHECRKIKPELPQNYQDAVETGIFKWARPGEPRVAFQDFRENRDMRMLIMSTDVDKEDVKCEKSVNDCLRDYVDCFFPTLIFRWRLS